MSANFELGTLASAVRIEAFELRLGQLAVNLADRVARDARVVVPPAAPLAFAAAVRRAAGDAPAGALEPRPQA